MRSNKGSAAVIAIIFMMFLLIIGLAFMPLMDSEVKHAGMDMDEQKAWYAAEAGIKYAKAYQTEAGNIKNIIGMAVKLSGDSNTASYKLTLKDKIDGSAVTSSTSDFPVVDRTYVVYSEGVFNGVKKIITEDFIFNKSSGGGGGGGSGGTAAGGLMYAGGTVTLANGGGVNGDIYAYDIYNPGVQINGNSNFQNANYGSTLLTRISDAWFVKNYGQLKKEYDYFYLDRYSNIIPANSKYYVTDSNQWSAEVIGGSGAVLYVYSTEAMEVIQKIVGPSGSAAPFTVIYDGSLDRGGLGVEGNVRIIVRGYALITSWGFTGKVMLVSNGDIYLSNMNVDKGFLSSNRNITIQSGSFKGQMQAKGNITVNNFGTITFDDTVLKAFGLPAGMTAY